MINHRDNMLLQWLDFHLLGEVDLSKDITMCSRRALIPHSVQSMLRPEFITSMNGLAMNLPKSIRTVFGATFLSDEVVNEVCARNSGPALLVVHHLFDMHCGNPGRQNGIPFHFINDNAFRALQNNDIAIYASHLPLDRQEIPFNTSLAFAESMNLSVDHPLKLNTLPGIGYCVDNIAGITDILNSYYPVNHHYGAIDPLDKDVPTAIIAGVISKLEILDELSSLGFCRLICGDVLVRVPSIRFNEISQGLCTTPLSIFCVSHLKSESCSLVKITDTINARFSHIKAYYIQENTDWK